MTDSCAPDLPNAAQPEEQSTAKDGLAELRHLLLGPEQTRLGELQARVDNLAVLKPGVEDVGRVLPEAIVHRSQQDRLLTNALTPAVEDAIKVSIKKDPHTLIDAIFPVMGPAIRKAIAEALKGMIQSLNQTLEYSVSLRGLKWRLEAWRTGKSFAEVVLLRTLVYRVEQVFLVHRHTGLLLQHVAADPATAHDPDLVSGMLTAIQDFVQDSFRVPTGETLETFQVGELTVWLEPGPQAILAAVIRGNPPHDLHALLQDTLATVRLEHESAFADFTGDVSPFATSRPYLQACLLTQTAGQARTMSPLFWIGLVILLLGGGVWIGSSLQKHWRWATYIERLNAAPGIVVTSTAHRRGHYVISGLRDPLAVDPLTVLTDTGLRPETVTSQWEPYQALYPDFILARARQALDPPQTVTLRLQDGTLSATGTAPHKWIVKARQLVPLIPGITQWQEDHLVDADVKALALIKALLDPPETVTLRLQDGTLSAIGAAPHRWIVEARQRVQTLSGVRRFRDEQLVDRDLQQLTLHKARIERYVLRFLLDTVQLVPGQEDKLETLAAEIQALLAVAQVVGKSVRVTIFGRTDQSGTDAINLRLSQQRANRVRADLITQGLDATRLAAVGVGAKAPLREEDTEQDRAFNRSVSFRVIVNDELD